MTGVPATKNDTPATHSTNVKKILQQHAPEVLPDLDKLHPIGPVSKDGKQSMILKFSKHSTVKNLYKKRKQLGNGMSLRPSITSTRKRTLKTCRDKIANEDSLLHKAVEFVFPDIDGDLNVFLKQPLLGRNVHKFIDEEHLYDLILQESMEDLTNKQ